MKAIPHPDRFAVVLRPEPGDSPDDLEDAIDDQVRRGRRPGAHGSDVKVVVLDLQAVPDAPSWMKAAGPEVPDVNLRLALGAVGYKVARGLGLPAFFPWFATVDEALTGGV